MLLGCIADDLTGATDLALMIARERMNTVQVIGVPAPGDDFGDAESVVVALKSRTNPPEEAVSMSLAAARALRTAGSPESLPSATRQCRSAPVVAGSSLANAQYTTEELEETAKLFLMLKSMPVRPLTPEQVDAHRKKYNLY
jgi:hypothetical protein